MSEPLRYASADGVATLTLDRPQTLNALSDELKSALSRTLGEAAADEAVRVVVLTGTGRGFCAGLDLGDHLAMLDAGGRVGNVLRQQLNPIVRRITEMRKPVIASVNGTAAGAGLWLACACDLRIAAASATFTAAGIRLGLGPGSGASWTLPRLVGPGRAMHLYATNARIDAERALQIGLVEEVVPDDELPARTRELAVSLAAASPLGLAAAKQSIAYAATATLAEAMEREVALADAAGRTDDHRNAVAAFLAKTDPTFTGQ